MAQMEAHIYEAFHHPHRNGNDRDAPGSGNEDVCMCGFWILGLFLELWVVRMQSYSFLLILSFYFLFNLLANKSHTNEVTSIFPI